jgi:hypothetical protein
MVSRSVVHTVGAVHWANGLPRTGRGYGIPVRPPAVWTNTASPPRTSGSALSSGNSAGWKVIPARPPR